MRHKRAIAFVCVLLAPAAAVVGQWQPTLLYGFGDGRVNAVYQDYQGGHRPAGGPGFWQSTPESWRSLAGGPGDVYAMWGDQQGGESGSGVIWAAIWSGTPESRVFLHPGGSYFSSEVHGMAEAEQVGLVFDQLPNGVTRKHAAIWHGTAASFRPLEPAGGIESAAVATDGTHQYGWATFADRTRAGMWSGDAQSWVSLDPMRPGTSATDILGASAVLQAGRVSISGPTGLHAAMWSGTAESLTDINPAGYLLSEAWGACDTAVVGWANPGGFESRPGIWIAPSFQFQELPFPEGFFYGRATSVTFYNGQYYIGGYVTETPGSSPKAVVWIGIPAPGSAAGLALLGCAALRRRRRIVEA